MNTFSWLIKGAIIVLSGLLLGVAGLITGAYIGGNFLMGFTFNGVRGYEAIGQVGFFAGLIIGIALGVVLIQMRFKKKD